MKICSKCQAENQDEFLFCAACGEALEEAQTETAEESVEVKEAVETEDAVEVEEAVEAEEASAEQPRTKKRSAAGLVVALVAAVAVIAVIIFMIANPQKEAEVPGEEAVGEELPGDPAVGEELPPAEAAVAHHVNAYGNQSYSIHFTSGPDHTNTYDYMNEAGELIPVSQEEVDALLDTEIASCAGYVLTNRDLPFYYSESYYGFYQMYGYLMSLLTDPQLGLDEQMSMDGVNTWQHMFVSGGVDLFGGMASVAAAAEADGFDMTEADAKAEAYLQQLETSASQVGYDDVEIFIQDYMAPGITRETCLKYAKMQAIYLSYLEKLESEQTVSDDEIETYYAENEQTLTTEGVTKVEKNVVNVRHILIKPEETIAEDGTSTISDEAWAAAEAQAQALYQQWKSGDATEESFTELASANTQDPGSQETGGLYEGVYPGQMVPEFDEWCFADSRAVGDHGIVKTSYGYHIMFFSGEGDYVYWKKTVQDRIVQSRITEKLNQIQKIYPMTSDLTKAVILDSIAPTVPSAQDTQDPPVEVIPTE